MSVAQTTDKFTNNLNAVFTDEQISTNVTYTYVQNFKDAIGFRPLLEQHLQPYEGLKAQNSTYSIADAVNFMRVFRISFFPSDSTRYKDIPAFGRVCEQTGLLTPSSVNCRI